MIYLKSNQSLELTFNPRDYNGNPMTVVSKPNWSSSNSSIVRLNPSTNGMTCTATATSQLGNIEVTVLADALIDGVAVTITDVLSIAVQGGTYVMNAIIAGAIQNT